MNLTTKYMGLTLPSPVVVSASPLSEKLEKILKMEDSGAGAVVLFSLFEEQIQQEAEQFDRLFNQGADSFAEARNFFPPPVEYRVGLDAYLELLQDAKERTSIPIIGSLNGVTAGGWIDYAKAYQEAGADGIELNVFFIPSDISVDGREVEQRYLDILRAVKAAVTIPVAMKLNPFFSSTGNMARQLADNGADALVLFNRFYQPDMDIDLLEIDHNLDLSRCGEIRLPLRWIGILHGQVNASLAATTGVEGSTELIKYLLAGADVVMTASCLFRNGIDYIAQMLDELEKWMQSRNFVSVDEMRGVMSRMKIANPEAYERANYIRMLQSYLGI